MVLCLRGKSCPVQEGQVEAINTTYTLPLEAKKVSFLKYHVLRGRGKGEICATLKELKMPEGSSYPHVLHQSVYYKN